MIECDCVVVVVVEFDECLVVELVVVLVGCIVGDVEVVFEDE